MTLLLKKRKLKDWIYKLYKKTGDKYVSQT